MAVSNASREMLELTAKKDVRSADPMFHVAPLSMLIMALVLVAGMAFFRSDYWLLGASFIAGGFLIASALLYAASKSTVAHRARKTRCANVKHLGTGLLSTAAGFVALFAIVGEVGVRLGTYSILVAQVGFALLVTGVFWLVLTVRDIA